MPDKIYKYRPFGVNTLRALTEAEVFYAKPSTFNDPLDCDPTIEVDIDRRHLEHLLYVMISRRKGEYEARGEIGRLRYYSSQYGDYQTDPKVDSYLTRTLANAIKRELDLELGEEGVLSLSATWKSGLMWSHYADEHRGICIEYDTRDQAHPRLKAVIYKGPRAIKTRDLYRWKLRNDPAAKEQVFKTYFYTKSNEWKYEKEWRDVSESNGVADSPFRITAILFGLRCDGSVIKSIVKLLNEHPQIKIWQVLPKNEEFGLRRYLVDRNEIDAMAVQEPSFLMFKDIVFDDANDHDEFEELGPVAEIAAQGADPEA